MALDEAVEINCCVQPCSPGGHCDDDPIRPALSCAFSIIAETEIERNSGAIA